MSRRAREEQMRKEGGRFELKGMMRGKWDPGVCKSERGEIEGGGCECVHY